MLDEVLGALLRHPLVAWVERINVGAFKVGNRFIRFGTPGMSDVTGQLKDGRRLEVEVKTDTGKPTPAQEKWIARVRKHGGVAFIARGRDDVNEELRSA